MKITRGQGYWQNGDDEIFNLGKDWLIWNWQHNDGRWFRNKTEAMRFIKFIELKD